jgi:hypothetical protein
MDHALPALLLLCRCPLVFPLTQHVGRQAGPAHLACQPAAAHCCLAALHEHRVAVALARCRPLCALASQVLTLPWLLHCGVAERLHMYLQSRQAGEKVGENGLKTKGIYACQPLACRRILLTAASRPCLATPHPFHSLTHLVAEYLTPRTTGHPACRLYTFFLCPAVTYAGTGSKQLNIQFRYLL